jgi:hypothetical protein
MKIRSAALSTLIFLAVSFPLPAKKNPARPFFLQAPFIMNGAEIPRGMYQLTLESSNSSVQVTLWREGQFIASASGVWVKSGMKFTGNTVLLRVNPDGTRSLVEIRLAGTAKTIVLNNSDAIIQVSAK